MATLDEVKAELMRRAGRLNPFEDIRREDAEQVVNGLTSLDRDLWAQLWSNLGLAYEAMEKRLSAVKTVQPGARQALRLAKREGPL
jgi:hypothetical protein